MLQPHKDRPTHKLNPSPSNLQSDQTNQHKRLGCLSCVCNCQGGSKLRQANETDAYIRLKNEFIPLYKKTNKQLKKLGTVPIESNRIESELYRY